MKAPDQEKLLTSGSIFPQESLPFTEEITHISVATREAFGVGLRVIMASSRRKQAIPCWFEDSCNCPFLLGKKHCPGNSAFISRERALAGSCQVQAFTCHGWLMFLACEIPTSRGFSCILQSGMFRTGHWRKAIVKLRQSEPEFAGFVHREVRALPIISRPQKRGLKEMILAAKDSRPMAMLIHSLSKESPSSSHLKILELLGSLEQGDLTDVTLGSLAEKAGISASRLSHLVFEMTGCNFGDLLKRARIALAAKLLATTDVPIMMIARRCGYVSQSAFGQMFHSSTDHTPSEFRYKHRNQET